MLKALKEIESMLDGHPHFLPDEVQAVRSCAEKVKENAELREKLEEERKKKAEQHEKLSIMATERHSVLEQITQTLSLYVGRDTPPEVQEMYQYLLRQHLLIVQARDALANELSAFVNDSHSISPNTETNIEELGHNDIITEPEPEPEPAPAPAPAVHDEDPDFAELDLSNIINLGNLGDIVESNLRHRGLNEENLYPDGAEELNGRLDIIVEEPEDPEDRPPSIARQYSESE